MLQGKLIHTAKRGRYWVISPSGVIAETFDSADEAIHAADYRAKLFCEVYEVRDSETIEEV